MPFRFAKFSSFNIVTDANLPQAQSAVGTVDLCT